MTTPIYQLIVRDRENLSIHYSGNFSKTEAQQRADEFDAGKFTVSIYAANTFAQEIETAEEIRLLNLSDDEIIRELGL
jgi:hypothetical protein